MARTIMGTKPHETTPLRTKAVGSANTKLEGDALRVRLRQKRSGAYVEGMTRLDAGTHLHGAHSALAAQALMDLIRQELPDVSVEALPIGIVAKCYLGVPYEVHTLSCAGCIIQHFKQGEALPHLMERARSLAQHPEYAFIEVYSSRLVTVTINGQTAIIDI